MFFLPKEKEMILKTNDSSITELIIKHKTQNVYLYIDAITIGLSGDDVGTYVLTNEEKAVFAIVYIYFASVQLLQIKKTPETLCEELAMFLKPYKRISGPSDLIRSVNKYLCMKQTDGFIMEYYSDDLMFDPQCEIASQRDFEEITRLICNDDYFKNSYDAHSFYRQLFNRNTKHNCESLIIRRDNQIVSHFASYAVCEDIAVLSGMITKKEWRGFGLGSILVKSLSSKTLKSGKKPIIYCYEEYYHTWYQKLGYRNLGTSSKLEHI